MRYLFSKLPQLFDDNLLVPLQLSALALGWKKEESSDSLRDQCAKRRTWRARKGDRIMNLGKNSRERPGMSLVHLEMARVGCSPGVRIWAVFGVEVVGKT
jgi:hypothetical protein